MPVIYIKGETVMGRRAMVRLDQIVSAVEHRVTGSPRMKVVVNTTDGKRTELVMTMGEFEEQIAKSLG